MACGACGCGEREICLNQGDDYTVDDGILCFDSCGCSWPAGLTAARLVLTPVNVGCGCPWNTEGTAEGTFETDDCGVQRVCFEMLCADTNRLAKGRFSYRFALYGRTADGHRKTLERGKVTVR